MEKTCEYTTRALSDKEPEQWQLNKQHIEKYPNGFLNVPRYFGIHILFQFWPWVLYENFLTCTTTGIAMHVSAGSNYIKYNKI